MKIVSQVFIGSRHLLLELAAPSRFRRAMPGQFLHVRIGDSCDPLLRRPLSIHDVAVDKKEGCRVKILYEIVGKGTKILSEKRPWTELDALGPLGHGFDVKNIAGSGPMFLVAGGMGVAPLFFLAKKITEIQNPKTKNQIIVLIGGRTKEHVLCEKGFKDLGCDVLVSTEDGSKGFRGRVTELLADVLASRLRPQAAHQKGRKAAEGVKPGPVICACGPKPMLAALSRIGREKHIPVRVSLEEFMGCGLGACLGCVIRTTSGYRRICHDGPVFDASEIIWQK